MMYSHDKMMMNSKPLGPTISGTNCFTGRYSPTYRVPEQMRDPMRRCMTNPPVSHFQLQAKSQFLLVSWRPLDIGFGKQ